MAVSVDLATLHSLVLVNNHSQLDTLLTSISDKSIMQKPFCGQTLLTLAVTLGHIDCVKLLLKHGSTALEKNEFGWSAYNESISYGNRDILKLMYLSKRAEYAKWVNSKGAELLKQVNNDLMDVEFDMAWSFKSIIPFVSSLCPYDEYKVYKKGANIRIDTTLVGYEQLNWIRGNISIIFLGDVNDAKLVVLDHERKIVQQIWPGDFSIKDEQIEEDISIGLNTPNHASPDINFKSSVVSRAKSGFLFKYNRTENVDGFPSSVWNVDSFKVVFPIRKEHLEAKPLPQFKLNEIKRADKLARKQQKLKEAKNKPKSRLVVVNPDTETSDSEYEAAKKMVDMKIKNYKAGYRNFPDFEDDDEQTKKARTAFEELALFRPSLDPPPKPSISAAEYKLKNEPMHLGRPLMIESNEHEFSGRLWMYEPTGDPLVDLETVPFKVETLYPMLSLMGINNEHLRSLDNFMSQTLPNGFPVQIEIPIGILPLSCMINFKNITRSCDKGDDWFKLPSGYRAGEVISASAGQ